MNMLWLLAALLGAARIQHAASFSPVPGYDEKASASELMRQTLITDPSLTVTVNRTGSADIFEAVTVTCKPAAGCTRAKAVALRSLIEPFNRASLAGKPRLQATPPGTPQLAPAIADFDSVGIELQVLYGAELIRPQQLPNAAKDPAAALQLVRAAFSGNRLFRKADDLKPPEVSMACEPRPGPFVVFSPEVVQYHCPGAGSACQVRAGTSNCNLIATDAFDQVYRLSTLGVIPTTALKEVPGASQAAPVSSTAAAATKPVVVAPATTTGGSSAAVPKRAVVPSSRAGTGGRH